MTRTFETHSADETRALAAVLGAQLQPGDVVCLIGDLGAGKTTWTQGLALGLGLPESEPVNSPTFTLLAEHPGGRAPLYHFDVYRLPNSSGLYDLAFDEYLSGDGVVVIEWADRIADALPAERLDITLTAAGPDVRQITLTAHGERAIEILSAKIFSIEETKSDWRELGFFAEFDEAASVWRVLGSRRGLLGFCNLLDEYANDSKHEFVPGAYILEHEHYGPYMSLTFQTWDKPVIVERGIYGGLNDFKRLATIVRDHLAQTAPENLFTIGDDYGTGSEAVLRFEVQGDDFDPADADRCEWADYL